jgi:hypothetical protein
MSGRHRTLPDPAATQNSKSGISTAPNAAATSATGAYANPKVKVLGGS